MSENASTSIDDTSVTSFTRHTSIWFADGNIVLLCIPARGGTGNTAFCVHRSVLVHHSKMFKDMFATSGETSQEMVDGCPIVRVYDNADDMANLLRRLYSLESREVKKSPSLELISSIMGLATKYVMDGIRQELVDYLLRIFPTTLGEYARFGEYIHSSAPENPLLGIDIGLKYNIPAIIPAACYQAARLDPGKIFDGFRRPDGTSSVSTSARSLCTRLKERLIFWIDGWTGTFATQTRPDFLPNARTDCNEGCAPFQEELAERYRSLKLDFFSSDVYEYSPDGYRGTLCVACLSHIKKAGGDFRQAAWELLPKFCDLEDWQTLRRRADVN